MLNTEEHCSAEKEKHLHRAAMHIRGVLYLWATIVAADKRRWQVRMQCGSVKYNIAPVLAFGWFQVMYIQYSIYLFVSYQ